LEDWFRTEGIARYDAYRQDPSGRSAARVFARLRQHHAGRNVQRDDTHDICYDGGNVETFGDEVFSVRPQTGKCS
jgi:hypothetical protein